MPTRPAVRPRASPRLLSGRVVCSRFLTVHHVARRQSRRAHSIHRRAAIRDVSEGGARDLAAGRDRSPGYGARTEPVMRVVSQRNSTRYRDDKSIAEIASELQVDGIVDARSSGTVMICASLCDSVRAADESYAWAKSYEPIDLLALQRGSPRTTSARRSAPGLTRNQVRDGAVAGRTASRHTNSTFKDGICGINAARHR